MVTNNTKDNKRDERNKTNDTMTMKGTIKQYNNQQDQGQQKGQREQNKQYNNDERNKRDERNKMSDTMITAGMIWWPTIPRTTEWMKGTKQAIQWWQKEWYNDTRYGEYNNSTTKRSYTTTKQIIWRYEHEDTNKKNTKMNTTENE